MNNILEVRNVTNKYDVKEVLRGVSFDIKEGQTLCIVGERERRTDEDR